jgi:hypothetical protein
MTRSITDLRRQGATFEAAEAVAIVQQLIHARHPDADEVEAASGPPSPDNVFVNDDGSVVCRGGGGAPAVSEVGVFLDSLLTAGSVRIPGGLRYTIARARSNVDAPPFDSLADLSRDLERHERGDRPAVVRRLLARARGVIVIDGAPAVERRRSRASASTSELRRALREAEARLYEREPQMLPVPIDVTAVPPKVRTLSAAAACLAAGLALIGTGELMHRRQPPMVLPPIAPAAVQLPAPAAAVAEPPRGIIFVHDASPRLARAIVHPEVHRVALRRMPARPAARSISTRPAPRPQARSVLDRLKLGWLRSAFSAHSEL